MTDAAGALAPNEHLGEFEGRSVLRTRVAVTRAGDGLSEALKVEPTILGMGQRVYVVLECEVARVRFETGKDDDDTLTRVHVLRAGNATLVDEVLVKDVLDDQKERILSAKEAAAGISRIPFGEDGEDEDDIEDGDSVVDEASSLANARRQRRRADADS